jgi:hypothetical protein
LKLRVGQRPQPGLLLPTIKLVVTVLGDHRRGDAVGLPDENPSSRAMAERYQLPRSCAPPTAARRKQHGRSPSGGSEGGRAQCMRECEGMAAIQGGRPLFKGDSPRLRPQPSRTESSPTRSKVLPLRHGGWVPRVMHAGPGQKKPNRRARSA